MLFRSDSVATIQEISTTINLISEISSTIAAAVEEQGAATQEIARNVQQASQGTGEVSANITGVNQAAGMTGASAVEVLGAASKLNEQARSLSVEVDAFLKKVAAA